MAQTEKGIVYPYDYNEVADVPSDFKALAESIDALLNNYSLNTDSGNKIVLEMNNTTYKIKAVLKDKDNNVISTSNEIDLPLENMVTNISYNNQKLTLTHQDGQTTEVSIADLISDLASKEEVSELQSQVDDLTTLVETELDSNTVEGTEIDVSDSAEYRGPVMPGGNLEQEQLSGKNLFNHYLYPSSTTYKGVTLTNNGDGSFTLNGTCTENNTSFVLGNDEYIKNLLKEGDVTQTAYYISGTCTKAGSSSARTIIRFNYDTGTDKMIPLENLSTQRIISKINPQTNRETSWSWRIVLDAGDTFNNFTIKYQVEKGTEGTDWEPYCGGQPSPNPSFPQNIEVVTGDNAIKHVGKNLFNKSSTVEGVLTEDGTISSGSQYVTSDFIKIDSQKTYTKTATNSARVKFYDANKNVISNASYSDISNFGTPLTFTIPYANAKYIRYSINKSILDTQQLEEGSTQTPYEPYREEEYELELGNIELCKIGDYSDILFKNVVGDENYNAELEDGAWYKKKAIDKVVLDGSENWGIGTTNVYYTDNILNYAISNNRPYNNYYKGILNVSSAGAMANQDNNTCAFNNDLSNKRFYVKDESKASSTDFKTWISSNNITVYYALNTPTYEKITDPTLISQLEALRKAKWFKGVNHFWTETNNLEPVLKGTYKQSNNLRIKEQDERLDNLESRLALLE